jgi:predicted RNA binding protein with dsRBD fold (UPF0201 family)
VGKGDRVFDADFVGEAPPRGKVRTRYEKRMARSRPKVAAVEEEDWRFEHVPLEGEVRVRAPVFPTEERARVLAAILELFPDGVVDEEGASGEVRVRAASLARFAEVLRSTRIRDTAREVLKHALEQNGAIAVRLNKQAAAAGRVNFVPGGEVLGAIEVEIDAAEPMFLAEELTWIEGESDERLFGTKLHTLPARRGR